MRRQVVEHHDVAGIERRRQELLDVGPEGRAGHRAVEHERCNDAALPEPGDQGRGLPMPVGDGGDQALAGLAPAVAPRHVGGRAGLVEEDEPRRVHEALPDPPAAALLGNVGPILLGGSQGLFYA